MMENKMIMLTKESSVNGRAVELNRDVAVDDQLQAAWSLSSDLRGSLNALSLCVRVLEGNVTDNEAREYAKHISAATQRIERLLAKRQTVGT